MSPLRRRHFRFARPPFRCALASLTSAALFIALRVLTRSRPTLTTQASGPQAPRPDIPALLQTSYDAVLPIRTSRAVKRHLSRTTKRNVSSAETRAVILLSPWLLFVLVQPIGPRCTGVAPLWLAYFVLFTFCTLEFGRWIWDDLVRLGPAIDKVLNTDTNRLQFQSWLLRRLRLRTQAICGALFAGSMLVALYLISPAIQPHMEMCPAYFYSIGLSAFLGGADLYWLITLPLMVRRITKAPDIAIHWVTPVRTPAISGLSNLLAKTALLTAIGLGVGEIPPLWALIVGETSSLLLWINIGLATVAITTLLFDTVYPQFRLSLLITARRRATLEYLAAEIEQLRSSTSRTGASENFELATALYQTASQSPSSTVSTSLLIQYSAALIVLATPYIVKVLFG